MLALHHLNNSRSQRILWLLEELGVEYEIKLYARDPRTLRAPDSLKAVHTLGKAPVITDGEISLAESGAIIEYLAGRHPEAGLAPAPGTEAHRQYLFWLHYAEGSLMPFLLLRLVLEKAAGGPMPFFMRPLARKLTSGVMSAFVSPETKRNLQFIETHLSVRPWFCGEALSGADFQMSFPLEAVVAREPNAGRYPAIQAYVRRLQARPAYRRALQAGGPYAYAGSGGQLSGSCAT